MNDPLLNIKIAFRSILKQRQSATINIVGLAVGMASCLLITFYIEYELSYDRFYKDADRLYRLNTSWVKEGASENFATTPPPLAPMLVAISADVEAVTRMSKRTDFTMRPDHDFDRPYRETNAWTVARDFLKVLDAGVLAGDPETMLSQPRSVVMPRATAIRYFGQEALDAGNVVGRQLGGGGDGGTKWQVTGVLEDQPENSHLQFDMLLSPGDPVSSLDSQLWTWVDFYSYVKLKDNSPETLAKVKAQLEQIVADHAVQSFGQSIEELRANGMDMIFSIQPLTDIHLKSSLLREMGPNGNITYVRSMIIIAVFIMVLACVNFINLSTARAGARAKEIGVRKVLGSFREQLIARFLTESLVMTFLALLIAFGLTESLAYLLNAGYDWHIETDFIRQPQVLGSIILITTVLGLVAGIYPAVYLTSFRPVQVLKGQSVKGKGERNTRNVLVTAQFVISIGLIIATLIINDQVSYIQSKDLGFEKENVLVIQNDREIDDRREEFKTFIRQNASILDASFSTGIPGLPRYMRRDFTVDGRNNGMGLNWWQADDSFLSTLNVRVLEGRGFDHTRSTDSTALLLNTTAVKELGLENPVGSFIYLNKGDNDERRLQVIGVIEDFNFQSFDRSIGPLAIEYLFDDTFKDYISIRLASGNINEGVEAVEGAWKEFEPNVPITYSFLDADFDRLFKSEQRLGNIFNAFTGLAIFIACLGLFGLASYTNEQRSREISIRKVLGATTASLLGLLYKGYFKLILVSFLLSGVLAYAFAKEWLSGFVYHTNIGVKPFAYALVGSVMLAGVTVIWQSLRTVMKNPAETLKAE